MTQCFASQIAKIATKIGKTRTKIRKTSQNSQNFPPQPRIRPKSPLQFPRQSLKAESTYCHLNSLKLIVNVLILGKKSVIFAVTDRIAINDSFKYTWVRWILTAKHTRAGNTRRFLNRPRPGCLPQKITNSTVRRPKLSASMRRQWHTLRTRGKLKAELKAGQKAWPRELLKL